VVSACLLGIFIDPPKGCGASKTTVPLNKMGQRALVAYERPDGQYNLHYSHWGGSNLRLKHAITPETPFGGDTEFGPDTRSFFETLIAGTYDDSTELAVPTEPSTDVRLEPTATAISRETALTDYLDYLHHEAFYLVDKSFDVTAFRTFWFGLQFDCRADHIDHPTVGFGALKRTRGHDGQPVGDPYEQGRWQALKAVVGDLIDRGVFTEQEALDYMKDTLAGWTGDDEEVLLCGNRLPSSA